MKLNKENFNKAMSELVEGARDREILVRATREDWYAYYVCSDLSLVPSIERDKVYKELVEKYGFEEEKTLVSASEEPGEKHVELETTKLFSSDILITCQGNYPSILYYNKSEDSIKKAREILDYILEVNYKYKPKVDNTRYASIVMKDRGGYSIAELPLGDKLNINVSENYNEDLPNEDIKEKLLANKGGFFIFNGVPGCGKSSYIKYLIEELEDKIEFVIVDPDTITFDGEEFKNFLLRTAMEKKSISVSYSDISSLSVLASCSSVNDDIREKASYHALNMYNKAMKKRVFVLEDCEKILQKRDEKTNPVNLSNILNITDGVLGDLAQAKFICTFNCDLSKIDSAILRKGRLLKKYEFKKLKGDRLENLCKKLDIETTEKEMSLADIYHFNEDTGFSDEERKKIGF